jgi:hypothetical protein
MSDIDHTRFIKKNLMLEQAHKKIGHTTVVAMSRDKKTLRGLIDTV